MSFTLPTFNLVAGIFRNARGTPTTPPTGTADVITVCNFSVGPRTWVEATVIDNQWLLLPKGTDIRDGQREGTGLPDWVEFPSGTGNWYVTNQVLFAGVGFPNEHVCAIVAAGVGLTPPQAVPYDTSPSPPPPPPVIVTVGNAFPFGAGPFPMSATLAPGTYIAVATTFGLTVQTATLSSTLLGTITPDVSFPGPVGSAHSGWMGTWEFTHPGGADTFTTTTPGLAGVIVVIYASPRNNSSAAFTFGPSSTSPLSGAMSSPVIVNPSTGLVFALSVAAIASGAFSPPWLQIPNPDFSLTDPVTGENWVQSCGWTVPSIYPTTFPFTYSITVGAGQSIVIVEESFN